VKTARALAEEEFIELLSTGSVSRRHSIGLNEAGIGDALTYLRDPGSHHAKLYAQRTCSSGSSRR
jgi:hypothetical protein